MSRDTPATAKVHMLCGIWYASLWKCGWALVRDTFIECRRAIAPDHDLVTHFFSVTVLTPLWVRVDASPVVYSVSASVSELRVR